MNEEGPFSPPVEDSPRSCPGCGVLIDAEYLCRECARKYPPALVKACQDRPWQYALKLTTGELIFFTGAALQGDYVTILFDDFESHEWGGYVVEERRQYTPGGKVYVNKNQRDYKLSMDRGLDIRLDQIVWCVDAPFGS